MRNALALGAVLLLASSAAPAARASHFTIDLTTRAGKASQTAHAETAVPGARPKARPVLEVKAGQRITAHWTLRNADAKATFKDVIVHFVAVREVALGQAAVPKLDKGVAAESALTMDFRPGDHSEGELSFTLDRPGSYLLRLETRGAAAGAQDHEHFAALDVLVH
jgi:hypothetical protein